MVGIFGVEIDESDNVISGVEIVPSVVIYCFGSLGILIGVIEDGPKDGSNDAGKEGSNEEGFTEEGFTEEGSNGLDESIEEDEFNIFV